jgi:4-hydroxybenzoate polyprenyltransferase
VGAALGALRATHPLPAAAVTALVGLVTVAHGADAATLGWVIASTAAGQASVGWSNDYLDREHDAGGGRREKPLVSGEVRPRTVLVLAMVALPLSLALSVPLGLREAGTMFFGLASAWAYNLGLKATALSWLPYAVSFGLAPAYIWLATDGLAPAWLVAGGALLGVAAHLLNVIPDLEEDRAAGVRGLPHRLGLRGSLLLACLILAAALALILGTAGAGAWTVPAAFLAVVLIGAVAWSGLTGRTGMSFRLAIGAAGAIVLVLIASRFGLGG